MPTVLGLDHLVLTVADLDATIRFYCEGLGIGAEQFKPADRSTRWALTFGDQKINLHPADAPFHPRAAAPTPGSADLCFVSETPLADWQRHLAAQGIPVIEGPIARTGAAGPILSLYVRDPDGNLIEISTKA